MSQPLSPTGSPRDRAVLRLAALVYVGAWIVGLLVAPSAPSQTASDAKVQAFFVNHHSATLIQALLVHGLAGIAFGVFVITLARCLGIARPNATGLVFVAAGLAAVAVSLVQVGLEIALNRHVAASGSAATTAPLFHAVNIADTVKLALLGIAVAAGTRVAAEAGMLARWIQRLGYALLPILIAGGLAFVVDSSALNAVLDLSLVLLLLWVAAVGIVVTRSPVPIENGLSQRGAWP